MSHEEMGPFVRAVESFFLLYFLGLNGSYIFLDILAIRVVLGYMQRWDVEADIRSPTGFEPPISIVAPAYNEEPIIAVSVRSLLQLEYPDYEIVVVNDGSTDGTLETLIREFRMVKFPEAYRAQLPSMPVRGVYRSLLHPNLRVVDKENGRKADAVNAGINATRYSLFLCVDSDSILQRDSLFRVVQPFLEDPDTVACGGTVRVANGCRAEGGFLTEVGLPRSMLARIQIVEYLRAFLFGRMGWSALNAVFIISGAFGLFRKRAVVEVGGYRHDTLGEDMELTVRLHEHFRLSGKPYRVTFVPDPICWTEVPETWGALRSQRVRWQRGLSEVMLRHRRLLFHPRGGTPGWLAYPHFLVFEWLTPLVEGFGLLFMVAGTILGFVAPVSLLVFLGVSIGLGLFLSASSVMLEELTFHVYPRRRDMPSLMLAGVAENFVYRQLHTWWRLEGLARWLFRGKSTWEALPRSGAIGR